MVSTLGSDPGNSGSIPLVAYSLSLFSPLFFFLVPFAQWNSIGLDRILSSLFASGFNDGMQSNRAEICRLVFIQVEARVQAIVTKFQENSSYHTRTYYVHYWRVDSNFSLYSG